MSRFDDEDYDGPEPPIRTCDGCPDREWCREIEQCQAVRDLLKEGGR